METWDYAHCLPYFKRMETRFLADGSSGADEWRGGDGPLLLERGPADNPLFGAFFEAAQEAGYPLTDDVNGYRQEGFARFDRNVYRGRRSPPPAPTCTRCMSRTNLTIETFAFATKIRFEGKRAVGVDYLRGGRAHSTRSSAGEVILCGGAINSPQLLQLSGVGDRGTARGARRSPSCTDLPGVGENLQDHLEVYIQYASQAAGLDRARPAWHRARPKIGYQWLFHRKGLGATNHFEGGGFARSNEDVDYPNLMFHFLPIAIRYDGSAPRTSRGATATRCTSGRCTPTPAGTCGSSQHRPAAAPEHAVQLPVDADRPQGVGGGDPGRPRHPQPAGVRAVQRRRALAGTVGRDRRGDPRVGPRGRRDRAAPSCTAAMGTGEMAVTDPTSMKVHGIEGLRVVDASVFPYVTNGNIYAPVMMVAEKAADLIAGNTPLPPADVPYYRYRDGMPLYPPGDTRNQEDRA